MITQEKINKTISNAVEFIQKAKGKTQISELQKATDYSERWFYKVADGSIKPSYQRALIVLSIGLEEAV